MNKPNLKIIFKNAKHEFIRQSPSILLGVGITGMITSTVMAVKATPKAIQLLEEAKKEKEEPKLTALETIKVAWKPYVPAVTVGSLSVLCLIGSTSINAKRTAALATAYKLSETALSEYRDAVVETIGEKKEKQVREKVADKQVAANPVESSNIFITNKGDTLCYEPLSGRYFKSSPETINKAINDINYKLLNGEYAALNDLYELIGLETNQLGDQIGWNVFREGKVEVDFHATLTKDNEPCLVMDFITIPRYDYYKLEY